MAGADYYQRNGERRAARDDIEWETLVFSLPDDASTGEI